MNIKAIGVFEAHALRLTRSCKLLFAANVWKVTSTAIEDRLPAVPGVDGSCGSA